MQLRDLRFRRVALLAARKHISHPVDSLTFSNADLFWVQLMLRCNLLHGLVATQGFQSYLGLKLISKVPVFRHSRIPSNVWDTP